jgi:hypothetical protein
MLDNIIDFISDLEFGVKNVVYVVVTLVLCITFSILSHAKINLLLEFFSTVWSEFDLLFASREVLADNVESKVMGAFFLSMLQYYFISRVLTIFLDDDSIGNKICSFVGGCLLQMLLTISYITYTDENWNCMCSYLMMLFAIVIIIIMGCAVYQCRNFGYLALPLMCVFLFTNPISKGCFAVILAYSFEMLVCAFILDGLAMIHLGFLALPITVVVTYFLNKLAVLISNRIIKGFSKDYIHENELTVTDGICFSISVILFLFWFFTTIVGVKVPSLFDVL